MTDKVKYVAEENRRFAELKPLKRGRFEAEWQLTNSSLIEPVEITVPPKNTVPIVFVPGIMGSNLCDWDGKPVWLLDAVGPVPTKLVMKWAGKKAGYRQQLLHPDRTKVYQFGAVPTGNGQSSNNEGDYRKRGWGEVSEASYHKFLLWLENKLNSERNPVKWSNFLDVSVTEKSPTNSVLSRKLKPGKIMHMPGLPDMAEAGFGVEPVKSDELIKRAKSNFPVYAFGYNWLASNGDAAEALKERINKIILENNCGETKCAQVILITHSMGGLVARSCCQLDGMSKKILGVVHGVMPSTGAAVAYRRCKVGMRDEDPVAGLVIGTDGKEVTSVFAQAPGALQLLPSRDYGTKWLEVVGPDGKTATTLPNADPYEEIYLEKERWWGLVDKDWLSPSEGKPIKWGNFAKNMKLAREFHRSIERHYHHNTFVFYGGGSKKGSFSKIRWVIRKGITPPGAVENFKSSSDVQGLTHTDVRTDGSNNFYVGGVAIPKISPRGDPISGSVVETSHWELRSALQDSSGDGTVPAASGRAPRQGGGPSILQQFEVPDIAHEPAYRDYVVTQIISLYAITKLAAKADIS